MGVGAKFVDAGFFGDMTFIRFEERSGEAKSDPVRLSCLGVVVLLEGFRNDRIFNVKGFLTSLAVVMASES